MKKIGIYFGSSSGTTADVAKTIAKRLGIDATDIHDVASADAASMANYEVLLLGSSTWGMGDLQDDWESFLPKAKGQNLAGKCVALFGCGDCLLTATRSAMLLPQSKKRWTAQIAHSLVRLLPRIMAMTKHVVSKVVNLSGSSLTKSMSQTKQAIALTAG